MKIRPDSSSSPVVGVSILIPAYNEERAIASVLSQLLASMPEEHDWEIIVIDDGSTDSTAEIVRSFKRARLVRLPINRGYGAALKTGIRHAKHEVICITDADGTYPNEAIPKLVSRLIEHDSDMIVGARTGANVAIPTVRKPAKWIIRKLAESVVGDRIPDLNSGLRVFRKSVALRFFGLLPDGFSFTTTITLGMLTHAYVVDYVPIDYHERTGQSKIRPIADTLNFLQLILRIALYFAPMKIFMPLSAGLLLVAILWGIMSKLLLGAFADSSTFLLAVAALQIGALGLLAEMINYRVPREISRNNHLEDA